MPGLYLHIPFCATRCPYCDFYTLRSRDTDEFERYADALIRSMQKWDLQADTVYFGGGTPSVLPPDTFTRILSAAREHFRVPNGAEITVECNPSSDLEAFLPAAAKAGVNRVSLGMQSAVAGERAQLGRLSGPERVRECLEIARNSGIDDLTLDIMLGVPGQTMQSLDETLDFCLESGVPHLSAYLLKLEEGTNFWKRRDKLNLPEEDLTVDMYLHTAERLKAAGFTHYEISNFAKPGFEGKHNLKYWHCEEYLGLGPGAHSFLDGKRFRYERDLSAFLDGNPPVPDGDGGSEEERILLALRLQEGYTGEIPKEVSDYIARPGMSRYLEQEGDTIRLTSEGFLLSNYLISELLERFEEGGIL